MPQGAERRIEPGTFAFNQLMPIRREPDVSGFYLGTQLHTFLRATGELESHDRVLGRQYIQGEPGKPGVQHVRLKTEILLPRPDGVPTRFPDRAYKPKLPFLELVIDSGLGRQPTDLNTVLQLLDTADSLASAVPGTEYTAIQVVDPPHEAVAWFEEQTTNPDSGWRKPLDSVPDTQYDDYVGVVEPRIPTYIKSL